MPRNRVVSGMQTRQWLVHRNVLGGTGDTSLALPVFPFSRLQYVRESFQNCISLSTCRFEHLVKMKNFNKYEETNVDVVY